MRCQCLWEYGFPWCVCMHKQHFPMLDIHVCRNMRVVKQYAHYIVLIVNVDELASEECRRQSVPFLCLAEFPVCSCNNQRLLFPTKEECQRLTTTTCRAEFNLAVRLGFGDLLPNCNDLPSSGNTLGDHAHIMLYNSCTILFINK